MSLLTTIKSWFTVKHTPKAPEQEPIEYQGFEIIPNPRQEGGQFRVQGLIRQGEQEHAFIRADLLGNREACIQETIRKAKLTIDQLGDKIFQ